VLRITVDSLAGDDGASSPGARYWSVSQLDNFNYCQCPLCQRTDSIEGSPSGSILRFVNAVADSFPAACDQHAGLPVQPQSTAHHPAAGGT
jgi:hypothetical protein